MRRLGLSMAMTMSLLVGSAACGPQLDYGPDHPCWFDGAVSGEVERELDWGEDEHGGGCSSSPDPMEFGWGTRVPDFQYDLVLDESAEPGVLGEVPAKVRIYVGEGRAGTPDKPSWANEVGDCTATLTEWLGSKNPNISASLKTYHVRGSLTCSAPAEPRYEFQESTRVTIEDAEFQAFWGKASVAVVERNEEESRQ